MQAPPNVWQAELRAAAAADFAAAMGSERGVLADRTTAPASECFRFVQRLVRARPRPSAGPTSAADETRTRGPGRAADGRGWAPDGITARIRKSADGAGPVRALSEV
jgi:hypothetical protein